MAALASPRAWIEVSHLRRCGTTATSFSDPAVPPNSLAVTPCPEALQCPPMRRPSSSRTSLRVCLPVHMHCFFRCTACSGCAFRQQREYVVQ